MRITANLCKQDLSVLTTSDPYSAKLSPAHRAGQCAAVRSTANRPGLVSGMTCKKVSGERLRQLTLAKRWLRAPPSESVLRACGASSVSASAVQSALVPSGSVCSRLAMAISRAASRSVGGSRSG